MVFICGCVRLCNDALWIPECIDALLSFCDKILILYDPKSSDKSLELITDMQLIETKIEIIVRKY